MRKWLIVLMKRSWKGHRSWFVLDNGLSVTYSLLSFRANDDGWIVLWFVYAQCSWFVQMVMELIDFPVGKKKHMSQIPHLVSYHWVTAELFYLGDVTDPTFAPYLLPPLILVYLRLILYVHFQPVALLISWAICASMRRRNAKHNVMTPKLVRVCNCEINTELWLQLLHKMHLGSRSEFYMRC